MTINAHLRHEFALLDKGYTVVAGLDEAGRGAWAGPVFAGAVILPLERTDLIQALDGVRDSKLISPGRREKLFPRIWEIATAAGVGSASQAEIDAFGIVPATRLAMRRALEKLSVQPDVLLTDAIKLPEVDLPAFPLIKGDQVSLTIAAASILAKVSRDHVMIDLDEQYPEYGFAAHKGYGTTRHHEALRTYGPADVHRHTFAPVRVLLGKRRTELGK